MDDGCTCICLTGNKVKGPTGITGNWAITGKNSDTSNVESVVHVPSQVLNITYMKTHTGSPVTESFTTNAYSGVWRAPTSYCTLPASLTRVGQGINEYGLVLSYSQLTDLSTTYSTSYNSETAAGYPNASGVSYSGREFATAVLALYKTVAEVLVAVVDQASPIGPENRQNSDCSICIVDRYGYGAVVEVSSKKAVYYKITNAYYVTDNASRLWGTYYNDVGTYGGEIPNTSKIVSVANSGNRTIYMEEAYNYYKDVNGAIDYKDMRNVLTYVHNNGINGSSVFDTDVSDEWDIIHSDTQASGFGVTGDERYSGALNSYFANCGVPAFLGTYLPMVPLGGSNSTTPASKDTYRPLNGAGPWDTGDAAYMEAYIENTMAPAAIYAANQYYPDRVRAVMSAAAISSDYSFQKWESFLGSVQVLPTAAEMYAYITEWQQTATSIYKSFLISDDFETYTRYNGTYITTPASHTISTADTSNPYRGTKNMLITSTVTESHGYCSIYKIVSGNDIWVVIHNLRLSSLPNITGDDFKIISGSQDIGGQNSIFTFGINNQSGIMEWAETHRHDPGSGEITVTNHNTVTPFIDINTNYHILVHMVRSATVGKFEVWVSKESDDQYKIVDLSNLNNDGFTFGYVSFGFINSDMNVGTLSMDRVLVSKSEIDFDRWNPGKVATIDPWKVSKIGGLSPKNIRTFGGLTRDGLWYK